jgi:hypothetical protein
MTARKPAAPKRDRSGYYNTPAGKLMSVTTILSNGIPRPKLVDWAAGEVARCAVDNLPRLVRVRGAQQREDTFGWLRNAANAKRDTAASFGSAIHAAVESLILGEPKPEPTEEQRPFLDAFERFCSDWRPQWETAELVVANPDDGWAGTADWWATLDGYGPAIILGDWKTGNGVYSDAALQLSAYRRAKVGWLKDGTEVEPPSASEAVVVHLRPAKYPDVGYRMYPMDTSDQTYADFRAAQAVAEYRALRSESLIGEPLVPAIEEVA